MRGMLEWRILAGIFAVLIVASSSMITQTGIKDVLFNASGSMSDWMQNSPFSGIFAPPVKKTTELTIILSADNFSLTFDSKVNITSPEMDLTDFKGKVDFMISENKTIFMPEGTDFVSELRKTGFEIHDVKLGSLLLTNIDYSIMSDNSNMTATDDSLSIYDFVGDIIITDSIKLVGNVTKLRNEKWIIG